MIARLITLELNLDAILLVSVPIKMIKIVVGLVVLDLAEGQKQALVIISSPGLMCTVHGIHKIVGNRNKGETSIQKL